MSEIHTHEGARSLVSLVLGESMPPGKIVGHHYDPAKAPGKLDLQWRIAGSDHGASLRYRLPCSERELRHDAAQLRDGQSYAHLRE